jgi:hypothetical protein
LQNGAWVNKEFNPHGGDQLAVTIAMPAQAAMPNWLRPFTLWRGATTIRAQATRTMPGRTLQVSTAR